ncbi:MAG: hypothetical protein ABID38_00170 [Candidatus Diapherotrites archaeon]
MQKLIDGLNSKNPREFDQAAGYLVGTVYMMKNNFGEKSGVAKEIILLLSKKFLSKHPDPEWRGKHSVILRNLIQSKTIPELKKIILDRDLVVRSNAVGAMIGLTGYKKIVDFVRNNYSKKAIPKEFFPKSKFGKDKPNLKRMKDAAGKEISVMGIPTYLGGISREYGNGRKSIAVDGIIVVNTASHNYDPRDGEAFAWNAFGELVAQPIGRNQHIHLGRAFMYDYLLRGKKYADFKKRNLVIADVFFENPKSGGLKNEWNKPK